MKIMAGLVAVAAMGLSQVAQAQEACEPFETLVDLAWEDFAEITGAERGDGSYATDYGFEGADECTVTISFVAEYGCLFVFASEAEALAVYDEALGLLDACMPAWKREDFTPADAGADFTPVQGLVAVGPGDLADLEWFVMLNRYNRPERPDWRLFVGLTYF